MFITIFIYIFVHIDIQFMYLYSTRYWFIAPTISDLKTMIILISYYSNVNWSRIYQQIFCHHLHFSLRFDNSFSDIFVLKIYFNSFLRFTQHCWREHQKQIEYALLFRLYVIWIYHFIYFCKIYFYFTLIFAIFPRLDN